MPKAHGTTNSRRCVAVDLGAGSGRVVLGEIQGGRVNLVEVGRFKTALLRDGATGYQYWDLDRIFAEIHRGLSLGAALAPLASVGVDGWGTDYVLLDADMRMCGLPISYRDKRTNGVMERVHQKIARKEIYRRTGIQFLTFNTIYQLAASVEQEPLWVNGAEHLLMIPDYLHFRMSGVLSNEYTNATTTQMCDLDGQWDRSLMDIVGIKKSLVRDPIKAGTILGDGIGPAQGLKVVAPATHDTASAVAGIPLENYAEAYIVSGTWSLMGVENLVPIASDDAYELNFTNEGGIERRFRILKNIMGMWPIQRICEEHRISHLDALVREAAEVPPWQSIVTISDREFLNPASMTEAIQRYCRKTRQMIPETPSALARSVFDSLALSYKTTMKQLETLTGQRIERIRIVGGGSQNHMMNQLCADVCERPVTAGPIEASTLGNLIAQFMALGIIDNLDAGREIIRASFEMKDYVPASRIPASVEARFHELLAEGSPTV